jgi:hypothetical protein
MSVRVWFIIYLYILITIQKGFILKACTPLTDIRFVSVYIFTHTYKYTHCTHTNFKSTKELTTR